MTNEQGVTVKSEVLEEEDDEMELEEDLPQLGPAMLGLQRVGAPAAPRPPPTQPAQVLNARGMPARIRKKNKLFFDDDIVNTPHHRIPSAKKLKPAPKSSPRILTPSRPSNRPKKYKRKDARPLKHVQPPPLHSTDRKIGQKIGMRLRNVLKLPKAHKWVCYEWFYSDVDRCLFSGENDFSICLKESFPELRTRELSRVPWTKIRRMMGKPRRCSEAFYHEERLELEKKRKKIRALQQRKATELSSFKDLPPEVPMQLVIGTKVTARLRKPQDGLFTGSIDGVDPSNNTYRITFERQGLGTHSVPDYEVQSNEPFETISVSVLQNKNRPRTYLSTKSSPYSNLKAKKDPLLSGSTPLKPAFVEEDGRIGGYPTKLLEKVVLVTKILNVKKRKIKDLKDLNAKAEKYASFHTAMPDEFQQQYACVLIELEKINHDLALYLDEIQEHCQKIAPQQSIAAMLAPSHLRERCHEEALEIVQRQNSIIAAEKEPAANESVLDLITDLTALMLQVKSLADSDRNAFELQVLQGTMEQIKIKLSEGNQVVFQNTVEVHMKHIQVGLGQNIGKLV